MLRYYYSKIRDDIEIDRRGCSEILEVEHKIENAPSICLIDFESNYAEKLHEIGFYISRGSMGNLVNVPNKKRYDSHLCLLDGSSAPVNLHEYNIVIINMSRPSAVPYDEKIHTKELASAHEQVYFLCKYPENIFDPRPFASWRIKEEIDKVLENGGILIVFAGEKVTFEYNLVKLQYDGVYKDFNEESFDTYAFSTNFPLIRNEIGKKTSILTQKREFHELFTKHFQDVEYDVVFIPQDWWLNNLSKQECSYLPLMENIREEIVSFYISYKKNGHMFVFPQIKNKLAFLEDLLTDTLPSIFPDAFPQYSTFAWVKKDPYLLPHEAELKAKLEKTKREYETALLQIKKETNENYMHYKCLHKLITETGSELVSAVKRYLEWLGFENVFNMDEINIELPEEDLQIENNDNILVIEVKGIGGPSKDSDCSQINKIVNRRMREKDTTKVHGLYIVNHQRFQEPSKRSNPPFNPEQIKDAEYESRGLLTTYQLFKLYFSIKNNIISKKEAREKFQKSGLIDFIPNDSISLGKPQEIHYGGKVVILNINTYIKLNDEIIINRSDEYLKVKILEIRVNDKTATEALSGEIGFKIDGVIRKDDVLFLKKKL